MPEWKFRKSNCNSNHKSTPKGATFGQRQQRPKGYRLSFPWFVYREAGSWGTIEISFIMPELKAGQSIHLILEAKDP